MIHSGFEYVVKVEIVFTRQEVLELIALSERCCGFLYRVRNMLDENESVLCYLTTQEMDLLLKITEIAGPRGSFGERSLRTLVKPLYDALEAREEHRRLNGTPKSWISDPKQVKPWSSPNR